MAPENTAFSFKTPVEGETLFLPALNHLLILYPGSYAQGSTSTTPPVQEGGELQLRKCTHTGAARFELFPG